MEFNVNNVDFKIVWNKEFITGIYICIYKNGKVFDQLNIAHYNDLSKYSKRKFKDKDKDEYFNKILSDIKKSLIEYEKQKGVIN